MLTSDLIRKRKVGIAMAAEMLATDAQSEPVRALLDGIAKNDDMVSPSSQCKPPNPDSAVN